MNLWVKNTEGKRDAMLSMSVWGFFIILIKVLVGGITFQVAGKDICLGQVDAAVIGAILTPTLGAYVTRRYTDVKYSKAKKEEENGAQ